MGFKLRFLNFWLDRVLLIINLIVMIIYCYFIILWNYIIVFILYVYCFLIKKILDYLSLNMVNYVEVFDRFKLIVEKF